MSSRLRFSWAGFLRRHRQATPFLQEGFVSDSRIKFPGSGIHLFERRHFSVYIDRSVCIPPVSSRINGMPDRSHVTYQVANWTGFFQHFMFTTTAATARCIPEALIHALIARSTLDPDLSDIAVEISVATMLGKARECLTSQDMSDFLLSRQISG